VALILAFTWLINYLDVDFWSIFELKFDSANFYRSTQANHLAWVHAKKEGKTCGINFSFYLIDDFFDVHFYLFLIKQISKDLLKPISLAWVRIFVTLFSKREKICFQRILISWKFGQLLISIAYSIL
jgi:hypothetical protein